MPPTLTVRSGAGKPRRAGNLAFRAVFALFLGFLTVFSAAQPLPARAQSTVEEMSDSDLQKTVNLLSQRQDPLVRKLLVWLYAAESKVPMHAPDLIAFTQNNPNWPRMHVLREKIEQNMLGTVSAEDTLTWFKANPPRTYQGIKTYVNALAARGQAEQARAALVAFWTSARLQRKEMQSLIGMYGRYFTAHDHAQRLDRLIWEGRYAEADIMMAFAGPAARAAGAARLALARGNKNASTLLEGLAPALQNSEGVAFERMRWRRKRGMDSGALDMLALRPKNTAQGELWWGEINIIGRRAMERGDYKSAHAIFSRHGLTSGSGHAQAEWLVGWLALRFLNQPADAYRHFSGLYDKVQAAISKSRAAYWSARAAQAMGDKTLATEWHKKSAVYLSTYYGQLSHAALFGPAKPANLRDPVILPEKLQSFERDERVRVVRLLHRADLKDFIDVFLARLIADAQNEADYLLAAKLARETGRYYYAVQSNKDIQQKLGRFLPGEGYPALPSLPLATPEKALVHAIIYRESMFNTDAQSPVGARGLMQLMPGTAKDVSRKIGQGYSLEKLTRDPRYNVTLGSTYLQDMIKRFGGFYPMAMAAYNAGPGRVDQWIRAFGDPRTGEIDVIDWVELLPIYETRNYIQRVTESYHMYRLRFGEDGVVITDMVKK
jgi:soluble lytic murein transglycosylase